MIIYKTTNLINGKIYIGQDANNNPKYLGSGSFFLNALRKYGVGNFKKEILCSCSNQKALDKMEAFFIAKYDSCNKKIGYNLLPGTANRFGCGSPMSIPRIRRKAIIAMRVMHASPKGEILRKKMSKIQKLRYELDPSLKLFGERNPMYGRSQTDEAKKQTSERSKLMFQDPHKKKKFIDAIQAMWDKRKAEGRVNEIALKGAPKRWKVLLMLDIHTHEVLREFKSATEVENELGLNRMNIGYCARRNKTSGTLDYFAHGYKWKFKDDGRASEKESRVSVGQDDRI